MGWFDKVSGGLLDNLGVDLGGTVFGMMSGTPSRAENKSSDNSDKTFDMAKGYWNETAPVRNGIIDRLSNFVNGGFDPTSNPLFAQQKGTIEQQYGTALDNLLATLPGGGAINEGITGLEVGKANSLIDAIAQIFNQEYMAALGMASASPATAFQGMGTGGNINAPVIQGQATKADSNMDAFSNIMSSLF